MSDYEKAQQILYALMRICPSRAIVLLQPENVIKKCKSSEELDFYYSRLCRGNINNAKGV